MQIQKHALPQQRLDLGARRCAERLDGATALANDDAFLTVALDVQYGPNIYRLGTLPKLIDFTRHTIGQLFMKLFERRFTDEFRQRTASAAWRAHRDRNGTGLPGAFRATPRASCRAP